MPRLTSKDIPVFFHSRQLDHRPPYEWAGGERIRHPETPSRIEAIFRCLTNEDTLFTVRAPERLPLSWIARTHAPELLELYQTAARDLKADESLYPFVFHRRRGARADPSQLNQTGAFCLDSGTPLSASTWDAAVWSAACAFEAARLVGRGDSRLAYGLCRPPGHHASREQFGGYCYLNNAALAAKSLRPKGKVAIVDIDFHHGNGTQEIFYRDSKVLFVSLHADPKEFYPYFSGYAAESGAGPGQGFNLNLPLPRGCDGREYLHVIETKALPALRAFSPAFLVVSAGFDTYKADPIGAFRLETADYEELGERLGHLGVPTVVVQEGGYYVQHLGLNVTAFLRGLYKGGRNVS